MKLAVAALISTYRRPKELARLLASLRGVEGLAAVIVVDNDGDREVRAIVERAFPDAHYIAPATNAGCGGGLKLAGQRALELRDKELTHFLILDDDAVVPPLVATVMADTMARESAGLAYPLVVDIGEKLGWLPGLVRERGGPRDSFAGTPEDFYARFGRLPRRFVWAQGICLLVAREAVEQCGLHREDFWVRGEDLEFSLRITARSPGVLVPEIVVQHLPPPEDTAPSREAEYLKHCALVQNIAYVGFRLPHGHRIAWTIAGALRRFFRVWSWPAFGDALRAVWRGAVLGEPAGRGTGRTFLARFAELPRSTR